MLPPALPCNTVLYNVGVGEVVWVNFKGRGNRYADSQESTNKANYF